MNLGTLALALFVFAPLSVAQPPAAPSPPKVIAPAPARLYDEQADAKQQIAAAVAKAKKNNRRVLVQWGGNWCGWCIRLHELCKADKTIAKTLQYEYDVVHIDAGKPVGKNIDLALSYGADVAKHGFPFLTVLDGDGKPVVNQETASLEAKDDKGESSGVKAGHDAKAVLKFLAGHKAAPLKAAELLSAGLADAKKSDKRVLLHFGAPWCVWCHRLEDWMERPMIASLLDRDFVCVKIDQDRDVGGADLLKTLRKGEGGIPWFVILDTDGKAVVDANGPKGNIGFPSTPEEIAHFESMLKATAKRLAPSEIGFLVASLKPEGTGQNAAPAANHGGK